jgi:predicted TIM-barrel fold metal-dependent hydrolase
VDLAAKWNVPVLIHSSIAPEDIWSQAGDILDVAEARPDVRFCLAHSCRFHLASLLRLGCLPNAWVDCSAHAIHCDAVEANLGIVATPGERLEADYSRPDAVMKALYDLLPDRLMWGSDAPFYSYAGAHSDGTLRLFSSYEREIAALRSLSEREKTAITHDNTLRFLGVSHV